LLQELYQAMSQINNVGHEGVPPPHPYLDPAQAPLPAQGLLRRHHWLTVLMPFLVYAVFQFMLESRLDAPTAAEAEANRTGETASAADADAEENEAAKLLREERERKEQHEKAAKIPYKYYPLLYTLKVGFTFVAVLAVIPGYLAFGGGVHMLGVAVGVLGAVLWIGLCKLHLEQKLLEPLGLGAILDMGRRPGFNPLAQIEDKSWAYGFLAIRFFGLAVIVPITEEFFLRGFLMRYVMHVDWPYIPFGRVDRLALVCGTAVPMLMHPAELFAAAAWFSLVTWLMLRTRSIWDCVIAHAVTNLLIGLWVLWSGDWWLM
jgi:CAAX prenyl protease-like protein